MANTVLEAAEKNFDVFATTLSVSPHKNTAVINDIGYALQQRSDIEFWDENFKKKDGFKQKCQQSTYKQPLSNVFEYARHLYGYHCHSHHRTYQICPRKTANLRQRKQ